MNIDILLEAESKTKVVADVNLNDIFYQLHDIAKKEALKGKSGYDLVNIGISEIKKTFIGACDSVITVGKTEKTIPEFLTDYQKNLEILKQDCFQILKTYVAFFIGEKQSNELNIKELIPNEQEQQVNNESKKIIYSKSLLENLFEDATQPTTDDQETADIDQEQTQKYITGYSLKYSCDYEGVQRTALQKTMQWAENQYKNNILIRSIKAGISKLLSATLGSTVRDFQKLSIGTFGNNKINVGQTISNVVKGAAGLAGKMFGRQDFAKIIDLFKKGLNSKYQDNQLVVKPIRVDTLIIDLKQQSKFDSIIKDKIDQIKAQYVIGIEAKKSDKYYSKYKISDFVDIYNNSVKSSSNLFTRLTMKQDNVIKIKDYNPDNEVKPDNIEDKKNESLELKANNLLTMIFENFHDYITLNEADQQTAKDFKSLFFKDSKLDTNSLQEVIKKLQDDDTFEFDNVKINRLPNIQTFIEVLKKIDDESKLNTFINRFTSGQEEKLKYMLGKFTKYLDKSRSSTDKIIDHFIINDKVQALKIKHIVLMFKQDTELTDDFFEIKDKVKDKSAFLKLLSNCKSEEDLRSLFDNYTNPATLKLFNDKITEYLRKNKLNKDDKVDLYLMFKKHIFDQNNQENRDKK